MGQYFINILASVAVVAASLASAQAPPNRVVDPNLFASIAPNEKLEWKDCYEKFKCAKLSVPADVSRNSIRGLQAKDIVNLAIIKLPSFSTSPANTPNKGTVHVALGGWSPSSTNFLVNYGESYAGLFPGYDLLAIDYRGTGWTTPSYRCFPTEDERQAWAAAEPALLGSDTGNGKGGKSVLEQRYARAKEIARKCERNGKEVGKYMGTYANAVDHWKVMKLDGRKKMSWWGVSSGAHLGQTVAALYPGVVDKFLFDGAVDSAMAYDSSFAQVEGTKDAEKGLDAFFYLCFTAGKANCAFLGNSTTTQQLKKRYQKIDDSLRTKPLAVQGFKPFDYSSLHRFLNVALHEASWFPFLAGVLGEVESGQAAGWIQAAQSAISSPPAKLPLLDSSPAFEALVTGVCLDERNHVRSLREFINYLARMLAKLPSIGAIFADFRLTCMEWRIRPVNVFPGKIRRTKVAGNIVYIGNTADPACSIDNAKRMSQLLMPSRIVKANGVGHTTLGVGSTFSFCLFGVMNVWFGNDTLPDLNKVCPPDSPPFGL